MTRRHAFQSLREAMTPTQQANAIAKATALREDMSLMELRQARLLTQKTLVRRCKSARLPSPKWKSAPTCTSAIFAVLLRPWAANSISWRGSRRATSRSATSAPSARHRHCGLSLSVAVGAGQWCGCRLETTERTKRSSGSLLASAERNPRSLGASGLFDTSAVSRHSTKG